MEIMMILAEAIAIMAAGVIMEIVVIMVMTLAVVQEGEVAIEVVPQDLKAMVEVQEVQCVTLHQWTGEVKAEDHPEGETGNNLAIIT